MTGDEQAEGRPKAPLSRMPRDGQLRQLTAATAEDADSANLLPFAWTGVPSSPVPGTPDSKMWLIVESGPERGRAVQVGEDPVTIGSAPGRTLELGGPRIAPLHAAVRVGLTGKLELVPLDLHAPLSVDGQPLTGTVSVHEGARIEVGSAVLTLHAREPRESPETRTGPPERPSADARRRRWPVPWR